jgi:Sulfotransferase family
MMSDTGSESSVVRFFIVGAPKAATTWLASALDTHGQIHLSPVKEPHFFAPPQESHPKATTATDRDVWKQLQQRRSIHMGWIRDAANYERLLTGPAGTLAAGEATVAYLHSETAPRAIAESYPRARVIIVIREPIARALSHLRMDIVEGFAPDAAEELLRKELRVALEGNSASTRYVSRSLYAGAIERYWRYFGRSQVLILRFEDLQRSPGDALREVAAFLRVDPEGFRLGVEAARNEALSLRWPLLNYWLATSGVKDLIRRSVPEGLLARGKLLFYRPPARIELSASVLCELKAYFAADIAEVERLTGLELSDWYR